MLELLPRVIARELMDDPVAVPRELAGNLRDIERANRWLGGIEPVARGVFATTAESVLDVGCGSADVPRALLALALSCGRELRVTCVDRSEQILELARRASYGERRLSFVLGEGETLAFGDRSFDVTTCSLMLHHCEPPAAVRLLAELRRVARLTPVVCDLRRSTIAYVATFALARLITRNRLTRHDAPLSVRRAYTPAEALALAREAGWRHPRVRSYPFYRMVLRDG